MLQLFCPGHSHFFVLFLPSTHATAAAYHQNDAENIKPNGADKHELDPCFHLPVITLLTLPALDHIYLEFETLAVNTPAEVVTA